MILLGIFIWTLVAGHPWIAALLILRIFLRFIFAALYVAAKST